MLWQVSHNIVASVYLIAEVLDDECSTFETAVLEWNGKADERRFAVPCGKAWKFRLVLKT
jgi:hypothetical protein